MNLHKAKKILIDEVKFDHRTKRWKKENYDLKSRCEQILSSKVGYNEPRVNWSISRSQYYRIEGRLYFSVNVRLYYYMAKEGAKELTFEIDPRGFRRSDKLKKILG